MSSSLTSCTAPEQETQRYPDKFVNSDPALKAPDNVFEIIKAYFTAEQLLNEESDVVYRLGHSSVIMKLDGKLVMADPVFSERASPVQFLGPKRFHDTPISLEALPDIDVVVISHDHYDHLDKHSVKTLASKVGMFLVPLKVGQVMRDWGVSAEKITELDWWESETVNGIAYTLTPTQHFSGRGLTDRDSTLWGSWVIKSSENNVYFSGDSGYFKGFKEIGDRFGPFDLTMIETGAYNTLWSHIHMFPEQSVQAHVDLKGKVMMPIHNSTFDLSMHDWDEPLEKSLRIATERGVTLVSPEIGQRLEVGEVLPVVNWWNNSLAD
ncbi:MBL fold metallo-hydrolase [Enterovibrio norvegicus]|uniref:MBL fold metallo-hydrolase n=1 Tax=Enterovibrio norvegicus TaxID=188144 RepID=UPI0024B1E40C|nr:MBL fold metallo-hydrolase [Enterovibrio norvegicus]